MTKLNLNQKYVIIGKGILKRFYSSIVRNNYFLREDLWQELITISLECEVKKASYKEACSLFNKGFYRFFKSFGYRKPRGTGFFVQFEYDFAQKLNNIFFNEGGVSYEISF